MTSTSQTRVLSICYNLAAFRWQCKPHFLRVDSTRMHEGGDLALDTYMLLHHLTHCTQQCSYCVSHLCLLWLMLCPLHESAQRSAS